MDVEQPSRTPYEFGPEDSRLIADLSAKMRFVGQLTTILGAVGMLYGLMRGVTEGITGGLLVAGLTALFLMAAGVWSMRAGREFQLIDDSKGADVSHLMKALANLRRLYAMQFAIAWVVLILLVVAVVFGLFADRAH